MKVLSLFQPWASLVVLGHKQIETRSWNTKYRGPLLIHASARWSRASFIESLNAYEMHAAFKESGLYPEALAMKTDLPLGTIIGQVNLVDTATASAFLSLFGDKLKIGLAAQLDPKKELSFGDYSAGRYGWLLSDPMLFKQPIPAKGKLRIWDYDGPLPEIAATLQERHQQQPQQQQPSAVSNGELF